MVLLFAAPAIASQCSEAAGASCIPAAWWIAPISSVVALIVAWFFYRKVMAVPEGNETMITIAGHVREGANAYLIRDVVDGGAKAGDVIVGVVEKGLPIATRSTFPNPTAPPGS